MSITSEHYRKMERMYLNANFNKLIFPSTQIEIRKGEADVTIEVEDTYHHALGAMHGSIYFKLLDDAAYFAANSLEEEYFLLTSSFNVHLTRPVAKGSITSKGKIRTATKSLYIAEATIYDEKGREVGYGTGNFMRSKVKLSPEIGYI